MSRKAAYALKARDPAFAAGWAAALKAGARPSLEGDEVEEMYEPPVSPGHGDTSPSRSERERRFAGLVARLREPPPLADLPPAQ